MSQQLSIVKPLEITDAILISSTVPEADYAAWASVTTYAIGDRVIVAADHAIYESMADANTGNVPKTSISKWAKVSATNRWKVFDGRNASKTAQTTSISYVLRPGVAITAAGILGLVGSTSVRVRLIDPVYGTVFDQTHDTASQAIAADWWEWAFGVRTRGRSNALSINLPAFPAADLHIDITGRSDLAVGVIAIGQVRTFGIGVLIGARVGIRDYSRKETDDWGQITLVERSYAKTANINFLVQDNQSDAANDFFAEIRATPVIYIASTSKDRLVIFGIYNGFEEAISYADYSEYQLSIEGLV